jgi:hypothetical protein
MIVHVEQAGLKICAADIVEIDVDAFGNSCAHAPSRIPAPCNRPPCIEAERCVRKLALGGAARDADDAAALDLRDLADERAD